MDSESPAFKVLSCRLSKSLDEEATEVAALGGRPRLFVTFPVDWDTFDAMDVTVESDTTLEADGLGERVVVALERVALAIFLLALSSSTW